jgi:hypothetical protein
MNSTPPYPYNKRVTFKTLILKHSLKYDHKNLGFFVTIFPCPKGQGLGLTLGFTPNPFRVTPKGKGVRAPMGIGPNPFRVTLKGFRVTLKGFRVTLKG